ncbi:MAG TPA: sortase [Rubrobacter sp.]|nr:sortase [Rubrobacter sp.]
MALALACTGAVAVFAFFDGSRDPAAAVKAATKSGTEPLVRSDPGVEPWKEKPVALVDAEAEAPGPQPAESRPAESRPAESQPEPERAPDPEPEPVELPAMDAEEPPEPTADDIRAAQEPRHYELPDGAVLGLTVGALGIHDAPVFDSVGAWALKYGVGHHPETSMPWSAGPQRNVYLAGHRLGFPGTASHLIFYRLDDLRSGDEILLKDRDGKGYRYRVTETFEADPEDSWVMGQVRDRDILTLQTCIGPNWERRLIVRADRV